MIGLLFITNRCSQTRGMACSRYDCCYFHNPYNICFSSQRRIYEGVRTIKTSLRCLNNLQYRPFCLHYHTAGAVASCSLDDNPMAKQSMEFTEFQENSEQNIAVQKDLPHSGDQVWIYKNDSGRIVRRFDPPSEETLSVEIPLVTCREYYDDNKFPDYQEKDKVSDAAIENACKRLREIKKVTPGKKHESRPGRQARDFNTLASAMGFDFGMLADAGEQGPAEVQTLVQALQDSLGSNIAADPNQAFAALSGLGSILGIPVAVSVEDRTGNAENGNERESRRVLPDGENAALRMLGSLFAHVPDPPGSNDAETDTNSEDAAGSTDPNRQDNRSVEDLQVPSLTDDGTLAEGIALLVEIGFPEGAARAALRITGGNADAAAGILFEQQGSE